MPKSKSITSPHCTTPSLSQRCILVNPVTSTLQCLHLDLPVTKVDHGPSPWRIPQPHVTFTPTSKTDPLPLRKQLALEHIASRHFYIDGSVRPDGSAGCAIYSTRQMWTHQRKAAGYLTLPVSLTASSRHSCCQPHLSATDKWCGDV